MQSGAVLLELLVCPIPGAIQLDLQFLADPAGVPIDQQHPIGNRDCLLDVVGHKKNRLPPLTRQIKEQILHVVDRKSTRLNSSHSDRSRMPSSA